MINYINKKDIKENMQKSFYKHRFIDSSKDNLREKFNRYKKLRKTNIAIYRGKKRKLKNQ